MPSPSSSRRQTGRNDVTDNDDIIHVSYKTPPRTAGVYGQRVYANGRRSSSFDVAIDGALETPRSFKGYTLGAWARNNTATISPVSLPSPSRTGGSSPSGSSPPRGTATSATAQSRDCIGRSKRDGCVRTLRDWRKKRRQRRWI